MLDQLGKKVKETERQKNKLFIDALQKNLQPAKIDPSQAAEDEQFIESFSGLGVYFYYIDWFCQTYEDEIVLPNHC